MVDAGSNEWATRIGYNGVAAHLVWCASDSGLPGKDGSSSRWAEEHDASGGGGRLQFAVEARQRQASADGQLQIGGVIGGKLAASGQLNDVGKGPVAGR